MPRRERVRMLLRVQDLLVLDSFHGSRVIAGHRGLNRVVEDIPIMEEPNIEHFVKSGDFLCTTLYPIYNDKQRLTDFIPNLVRLGLAGLGIKPNRYVSEVPQMFIEPANALDFPVILLPADQSLSSQINAFLKESLHRKSRELEYRDEIHNKLMSIMLQGEEYDGLAYNLAKLVRKNVALYSARGEKLAEYRPDEDFDFEDCCADSGNWLGQLSMNEDFKQLQQDAGCAVLYRVYYGHEKAGYIVMSSRFTFSLHAHGAHGRGAVRHGLPRDDPAPAYAGRAGVPLPRGVHLRPAVRQDRKRAERALPRPGAGVGDELPHEHLPYRRADQ